MGRVTDYFEAMTDDEYEQAMREVIAQAGMAPLAEFLVDGQTITRPVRTYRRGTESAYVEDDDGTEVPAESLPGYTGRISIAIPAHIKAGG